jgi:hypothetical protein
LGKLRRVEDRALVHPAGNAPLVTDVHARAPFCEVSNWQSPQRRDRSGSSGAVSKS